MSSPDSPAHAGSLSTPAPSIAPSTRFEAINASASEDASHAQGIVDPALQRRLTNEDLVRELARRRTSHGAKDTEDWAQIEKLVSHMFGHERKATSEEEKTRHLGVVWRNLSVKGIGLGAALQPTNSDILLAIPRLLKRLVTCSRSGNGAAQKPPIRTIIDDFSVSSSNDVTACVQDISKSNEWIEFFSDRDACVQVKCFLCLGGQDLDAPRF